MMQIQLRGIPMITLLLIVGISSSMHAAEQLGNTKSKNQKKHEKRAKARKQWAMVAHPDTITTAATTPTQESTTPAQDPEITATADLYRTANTLLGQWNAVHFLRNTLKSKQTSQETDLAKLRTQVAEMEATIEKTKQDQQVAQTRRLALVSQLVQIETAYNAKLGNITKIRPHQRKTRSLLDAALNAPDIEEILKQSGIHRHKNNMTSAPTPAPAAQTDPTLAGHMNKATEPTDAELLKALTPSAAEATAPQTTTAPAQTTTQDGSWFGWFFGSSTTTQPTGASTTPSAS